MTEKYAIKYNIDIQIHEGEGFSKEDILREVKDNPNLGACDSIIFTSILKPKEGGFGAQSYCFDGKSKGKYNPFDVFKAWLLLSYSLSKDKRLPDKHRKFLEATHEAWLEVMQELKNEIH